MLYPVHIHIGRQFLTVQHQQRVRLAIGFSALTWVALLCVGGQLNGSDGGVGTSVCIGATVVMNHLVASLIFRSFDSGSTPKFLSNARAVAVMLLPILLVSTICTLLFKVNGLFGEVSLLSVLAVWLITAVQLAYIAVICGISPRIAA